MLYRFDICSDPVQIHFTLMLGNNRRVLQIIACSVASLPRLCWPKRPKKQTAFGGDINPDPMATMSGAASIDSSSSARVS